MKTLKQRFTGWLDEDTSEGIRAEIERWLRECAKQSRADNDAIVRLANRLKEGHV